MTVNYGGTSLLMKKVHKKALIQVLLRLVPRKTRKHFQAPLQKFTQTTKPCLRLHEQPSHLNKKEDLARSFPAGIYLLKINNKNTRTRREICSKLTIKTPERHQ